MDLELKIIKIINDLEVFIGKGFLNFTIIGRSLANS